MNTDKNSLFPVIVLICGITMFAALTARLAPGPPPNPPFEAQHPTGGPPHAYPQPPTNPPVTMTSTLPTPADTPTASIIAPIFSPSPTVTNIPPSVPPPPPHGILARVTIGAGMNVRTEPMGGGTVQKVRRDFSVLVVGCERVNEQRWFKVRLYPAYDQNYWMASEAEDDGGAGLKITLVAIENPNIDLFEAMDCD